MSGWRLKLLFFVVLLAAWEAMFRLRLWPSYVFPSPLEVVSSIANGFADGSYSLAILSSMRRVVLGYGLSLVVGIPLGLVLGRIRLVQDTIGSVVLGLQALPSICWLPLALLAADRMLREQLKVLRE